MAKITNSQKIDQILEMVIRLDERVGQNPDTGLMGDVFHLKCDFKKLMGDVSFQKKILYGLIGLLVGSGIITADKLLGLF